MIYVVALNPSVDYLMQLDSFQLGEMNRSQQESIFIGGKSINVSIMLNNLGVQSTLLGFVAGFTGKFIQHQLEQYQHIDTQFIEVDGMTRINVKLNGIEETEINGIGTEVSNKHIKKIEEQLDQLSPFDLVVFSGKTANGMNDEWYVKIIKKLSDKNVPFIIDIASDVMLDILPYKPLLIKPNKSELEIIFNTNNLNRNAIIPKGQTLIKKGAQHCIVSLGSDGSFFFVDDIVLKSTAPHGKTVSSVGAGDSMIAGFIASWQKDRDWSKAYKLAASCGAATAYTLHLSKSEEIQSLMKEIQIKQVLERNSNNDH